MLVFTDVSAEREDRAHGRNKLALGEDQSAVPAGRTRAPEPTCTCPIPAVQQRQATPVSASACRHPDYHKSTFTIGKPTHWPNCFPFILQIWYKVKKQLVQQCSPRSNCEYQTQKFKLCHLLTIVPFQTHKGRHFEWSIFLPVQLQELWTGAFKLKKVIEKHHKSII